jgi:PAS domain S-box-containing protein
MMDASETSISIAKGKTAFSFDDGIYQQLVEHSPDAIYILVGEEIIFANESMLELVGATKPEEVICHVAMEFIPEKFHAEIQERRRFVRETGKPTRAMEMRWTRLDGTEIDVEYSSAPLHRDFAGIQIHLNDITDRKKSEAQLLESERSFHQLADSMPHLVWTAGPDGNLEYRNKKWGEKIQLAEGSGFEEVWRALLHPTDVKHTISVWKNCIHTGEPFQVECRCVEPRTGEYRWHLGRALPIKDEQGKVVRWFGTCTDIHDQKLAEIALQRAQEQMAQNAFDLERRIDERTIELQEIVRSTEALNYSIAHDLRAPLRAMIGFSNVLLEECASKLDETGCEYAQRIAVSARRMDSLISALLNYGQLNYEELSFSFVDANIIFDFLLRQFQAEARETNATIRVAESFPTIWTNEIVFRKIFEELISNALKFRSPDRPPLIEIWTEEQESKTIFWIRDNGIGIPPEHYERIFRVMESLHDAKKYPGMGIGLAIVRRGVERLGGRAGVKSDLNTGTSFWIELPKALV